MGAVTTGRMKTSNGLCIVPQETASAGRVVTKIAWKVEMNDAWVGSSVEWLMALLKKTKAELCTAPDTLVR